MSRYVITELWGYTISVNAPGGSARPGLTICVLDSCNCYREVGCWSSEHARGLTRADRFADARRHAETLCAGLNAEDEGVAA